MHAWRQHGAAAWRFYGEKNGFMVLYGVSFASPEFFMAKKIGVSFLFPARLAKFDFSSSEWFTSSKLV